MLASGMCLLQREWRSRVSATQAASAARSECPERATSSAVKGKSHLRYERRVLRLLDGFSCFELRFRSHVVRLELLKYRA